MIFEIGSQNGGAGVLPAIQRNFAGETPAPLFVSSPHPRNERRSVTIQAKLY
jgi:hypothetical protein